jgi:ABC-type antimicrobial peptide transport system permease subunit
MRKLQTAVLALTISLLFGVVTMILICSGSLTKSLDIMSGELFDGKVRMIVTKDMRGYNNTATLKAALDLYNASQESTKRYPIITVDSAGNTTEPYLDVTNEFAKAAIDVFVAEESSKAENEIGNLVRRYGGELESKIEELRLKSGRMVIDAIGDNSNGFGERIITIDDSVLKNLVRAKPDTESVPVIVSSNYAEKLAGLEPLPDGASLRAKKDRLQRIYKDAPRTVFKGNIVSVDSTDVKSTQFQVIGVVPSGGYFKTGSIAVDPLSIFLSSLASVSTYDMILPSSYMNSYITERYGKSSISVSGGVDFMVQFNSPADARRFMDDNDCKNPDNNCSSIYVGEFVTRRTALYSLTEATNIVITYIGIFLMVIAVATMAGTLTRIISDEKQLTAIYRAVGASKSAVRKIYFTYSMILSATISVFALVLGSAGALLAHLVYSRTLTLGAKELYGLSSSAHGVYLMGVDFRCLFIVLTVFVAGTISIVLTSDKMVSKNVSKDLKEG